MFKKITSTISDNFGFVLLGGVATGIIFPSLSLRFTPNIITMLLMGVIFLGFMRTDYGIFKKEIKNFKYILYCLVFNMGVIPVMVYYGSILFSRVIGVEDGESWATGNLVHFAFSPAAITPTLSILLRGKLERTLLVLFISSLIVPFSLPLLLGVFTSASDVSFSFERALSMFLWLLRLIIIPWTLSLIVRKIKPSSQNAVTPHTTWLSICLLFFVVFGSVSGIGEVLNEYGIGVIKLALISLLGIGLSFTAGYFLSIKSEAQDRITLALISAWPNIGMALAFAKTFYGDKSPVSIFLIISVVVWDASFLIAKYFVLFTHREKASNI